MAAPALVALAHGSRDPRSAATIKALVAEVKAMRPDLKIETAFLDLSKPSFDTVVDLRVVRLREQERDDDDLVVTGLDQAVDDRVEARLGEVEEGGLDLEVGAHRLDLGDERLDRRGRTRVPASVGQGNQSRSSHQGCLRSCVVRWCNW